MSKVTHWTHLPTPVQPSRSPDMPPPAPGDQGRQPWKRCVCAAGAWCLWAGRHSESTVFVLSLGIHLWLFPRH